MNYPATSLVILLFIAFLIFLAYSGILLYHWFNYAMNTRTVLVAITLYMGLGFLMLFIMTTALTVLL